LAVTAAAVVAMSAATTCSATPSSAREATAFVPGTATPAEGHRTATTSLGGLSVTLTLKPWRADRGTAVQFNLSVSDSHATGALGYVVEFGDGSSAAPAMPMYCLAGGGRPAHQTWQLSHRYVRSGHYKVTASGFANCGSGRVTATVNIVVL
jgi:PKD domain